LLGAVVAVLPGVGLGGGLLWGKRLTNGSNTRLRNSNGNQLRVDKQSVARAPSRRDTKKELPSGWSCFPQGFRTLNISLSLCVCVSVFVLVCRV